MSNSFGPRKMRTRLLGLALIVAVLGMVVLGPLSSTAAAKGQAFPVTQTRTVTVDGTQVPATFEGTFSIQKFEAEGGTTFAVGTLNGTLTNTDTGAVIAELEDVATRIAVAGGNVLDENSDNVCEILFLELGPIHLDLLGLVVDVSQITIEITAVPGEGNLLGNLLCAVAGLLDPEPGPAGLLKDLLNLILDALEFLQ